MSTSTFCIADIGFTCNIDGPGQRMVVYLKGCNLHCPWCASPETIAQEPQVLLYPERAQSAQAVCSACPEGAIMCNSGFLSRDTARCLDCLTHACLDAGSPAFERMGTEIALDVLMAKARKYRPFMSGGGGVTIGGGEPTGQFSAVSELLAQLHAAGIHTAMETNGTHRLLPELFANLDLLLIDFKHPDAVRCAEITGLQNTEVLENIRRRHAHGGDMVVRIPLVPGYNADQATLVQFAEGLADVGRLTVEILPFHNRGRVKWQALGLDMPADSVASVPSVELLAEATIMLTAYGHTVRDV